MVTAERLLLIAGATLSLSLGSGSAQAQAIGDSITAGPVSNNFARDRNVSVRQRPRAEYEALGVHVGTFLMFPRVMVTVEHDDNIFAQPTNELGDTILKIQPELAVTSDWTRHFLSAYARGTYTRFDEFEIESTDEWMAGGSARLDIRRDTTLSGGFDFARLTEPRTGTSLQGQSVVPIQYEQDQARVVFSREFNRLRTTARFDYVNYDFNDGRAATGASVDQDDRDREELTASLRGDYAFSPATAGFLQVALNEHNYDITAPGRLGRDSDGVTVLAGLNFELSNLLRGDIGVGYVEQNYDDPRFRDISGLGVRGQLEWFPTQITTVTLTAARRVSDSGIPGAAGYLESDFGAQIDHELRRNIILTGQVSYGEDNYQDLDRLDRQLRFAVSGTYLVNRSVGLTIGYSYYDQESSGLAGGQDYKVNKIGATVTVQR